jgi:DNA polymerase
MNNQNLLDKVAEDIIKNLNCELKNDATNLVFGKGNPNADILFIGEAPGNKEDLQGIPFVGNAGKILDKKLSLLNLTLDDVYIANILKYRPPQNRDPTFDEMKLHTPYLVKQIEIIKPKIICTLGNFSTKYILSDANLEKMKKIQGVSELHGELKEVEFKGNKIKVFPIYHPTATVYRTAVKQAFEEDFIKLGKILYGDNFKPKLEQQKTLV